METIQNKTRHNITSISRNSFLDGLKGIAILCVIITHFQWTDTLRKKLLFPFWIDMAVPIFMIISGYVNACSGERNGTHGLRDAYRIKRIKKKLFRYLFPFLLTYFVEVVIICAFSSAISPWSLLYGWMGGGYGPGSYYVPIMIQFIFLFPLIERTIRKYSFAGVIFWGGCNVLYEAVQRVYGMGEGCYRLLIFRYMLLIAYGCYLALHRQKVKKWISILSCGTGIIFIFFTSYMAYEPRLFIYWTGTCCIAVLYVIPLLGAVIRSKMFYNIHIVGLAHIGRASFHIYLFQMVYYRFAENKLHPLFPNDGVALISSIAICLLGGVMFYVLEGSISRQLFSFLMERTWILSRERMSKWINTFCLKD